MRTLLLALALAAGGLLLTGCNTFESRSKEKATVFATLDPATQERLKAKFINVGDTFDMVYIALGAPDEKREKLSAKTQETTWVYNSYWQEYRGEALTGYRRHVVRDANGNYQVFYEQNFQPVYETRVQEYIRVTFANGKVTVVEQAKR